MNVIGGVLGRAGEAGKLHRLSLATQKIYSFQPATNLRTPGHLDTSNQKKYPKVIKLGGTVQELEEQDRGIVHDYNIDVEPPEGEFDKKLEGLKRQFLKGPVRKEVERKRKLIQARKAAIAAEKDVKEEKIEEQPAESMPERSPLREKLERVLKEKRTSSMKDGQLQRSVTEKK